MASIPTNRSTSNTSSEHVADHNELARLHNLFDGTAPNLGIIDVSQYASGGSGSYANPWTGWESGFDAALANNVTFSWPAVFATGSNTVFSGINHSQGVRFIGLNGHHISYPPTTSAQTQLKSEIRYTGSGSTTFLDGRDSFAFAIEGVAMRYSSNTFTGTLIDLSGVSFAPAYGFYARNVLFSTMDPTGVNGAPAAQCVLLSQHCEAFFLNCSFAGAGYGVTGRTTGTYSNAITFSGGRFSYLRSGGVKNPGSQWTFTGTVFESNNSGLPAAVWADQYVAGLAFTGCGFWDGGAAGDWVYLTNGQNLGIAVNGCYVEQLSSTTTGATLLNATSAASGVSINGCQFNGNANCKVLADPTKITNRHDGGNGFVNGWVNNI